MDRRYLTSLVVLIAVAASPVLAQETPPIMPKIQETKLPEPVTLPTAPTRPADVPNRAITADEAAKIAIRHQPSVLTARTGVVAAQGRVGQAKSKLLPTLGITSTTDWIKTISVETGAVNPSASAADFQSSASLQQLVYDFGHTNSLVKQSEKLALAAEAIENKTRSDLVQQVKQAYYTLVQSKRLVAVNEENVRNQQGHLDLAQALLNNGVGLPSDVVRAQTTVSEAILNLNLAQSTESAARVNLALTMGLDSRTDIEPNDTDEPEMPSMDVSGMIDLAGKQRPEVKQAQLALDAAQYNLKAAETTNAPSLVASLGLGNKGDVMPPGTDTLTVAATVQWNPFDSGYTSGKVKEAKAGVDAAKYALDAAKLQVSSDVAQAYLNLRTAEQRIVTATAEVANGEEGLRLAEGRYRSGIGTFIDVTDAQTALVTARTNLVNAHTTVNQARAALVRAIGTPVPTN